MSELIDIGANLTHDSFDTDRQQVLERAVESGVGAMIVTGSSVKVSRQAADLAATHPGLLYATAGIHPHHAKDCRDGDIEELGKLLVRPEVVAAGECGLDFFRNFSTPQEQQKTFELQLQLAVEHNMPVFLHQRDAHEDFVRILEPHLGNLPRAVAHCFTGTERELRAYLEYDLYIGITGWICDERRGIHLRELVDLIPLDRLMLETDAPYLLPRDLRPKPASRRNEPMHLAHILKTVASCRNMEVAELATATTANARRFFDLANSQVHTHHYQQSG